MHPQGKQGTNQRTCENNWIPQVELPVERGLLKLATLPWPFTPAYNFNSNDNCKCPDFCNGKTF